MKRQTIVGTGNQLIGIPRLFLGTPPAGLWVPESRPLRLSWGFVGRYLLMELGERADRFRFLVRDRGAKFTAVFDAVFAAASVEVLTTPVRVPQVNAYAKCWVGTVRRELLDRMLIFGRRHLQSVVVE